MYVGFVDVEEVMGFVDGIWIKGVSYVGVNDVVYIESYFDGKIIVDVEMY